jgi:hypothetical protein
MGNTGFPRDIYPLREKLELPIKDLDKLISY